MSEQDIITALPGELPELIETLWACDEAPCLWSMPGLGKSSIVYQVGTAAGLPGVELRAALIDGAEAGGFRYPDPNGGKLIDLSPAWWPSSPCFVFLDELNRGATMVQNALFQPMDRRADGTRRMGAHELPAGVKLIAACNRESDGGGVQKMPQALANRFTHIFVEPSVNDWRLWAAGAGLHPAVIAFISYRGDLLAQFSQTDKAWPSPRTWEKVSRITAELEAKHGGTAPSNLLRVLSAGAVGQGAAGEWAGYYPMYKQLAGHSLDEILQNPATAAIPSEMGALYAVASGLAQRAEPGNIDRVVEYCERMPSEFNIFSVKAAKRRDPRLTSTPAITRWNITHDKEL